MMNSADKSPLEIERKWLVSGWPKDRGTDLPLIKEELMRQGYLTIEPTVRIREETIVGKKTDYILCFKSRGNGLTRKEIEFPILPKHDIIIFTFLNFYSILIITLILFFCNY